MATLNITNGRGFIRMMMPIFGLDHKSKVTNMTINAPIGGLATAEVTLLANNTDIEVTAEPEANNTTTKRYIIEVREVD